MMRAAEEGRTPSSARERSSLTGAVAARRRDWADEGVRPSKREIANA